VADIESRYLFVAEDVIKRKGLTKADVIKGLPKGLSPRSAYAYLHRGQGAIAICAALAESIGCTLNDLYVPTETGTWESTDVPKKSVVEEVGAEKADRNPDGIMEALMACNDPELLMYAAFVLGSVGKMPEAGMLKDRASQLKDGDSSAE